MRLLGEQIRVACFTSHRPAGERVWDGFHALDQKTFDTKKYVCRQQVGLVRVLIFILYQSFLVVWILHPSYTFARPTLRSHSLASTYHDTQSFHLTALAPYQSVTYWYQLTAHRTTHPSLIARAPKVSYHDVVFQDKEDRRLRPWHQAIKVSSPPQQQRFGGWQQLCF